MILMNFINRITGHKNKQTAEIKPLQPRLYVIVKIDLIQYMQPYKAVML
jgi:hypothetical protein